MTTTVGGAREQVARLLTLVPYLHARGEVGLADAADALGVGQDQLVRDLRVLFMCGLPGGFPDDLIDVDLDALETEEGEPRSDGVIRVRNVPYLARPLRLTATEASAVIVALRALRAGARGDTVAIVDRVLGKLESAASAGPVDGRVAVDLPDPREDEPAAPARPDEVELLARLEDAVRRQVQVELDYYTPARDEQSTRVVDPHGLAERDGHTYLDAYCHSADAPRLFRTDRIAAARVLDAAVTTAADAPRDLEAGFFAHDTAATRLTVRLATPARWVTEYYPVEDVRPAPGAAGEAGAVDVDLLVADERWLVRLLLRLAPHAQVVDSQQTAEHLAAAARAARALYG